jgi:hypothetical protein
VSNAQPRANKVGGLAKELARPRADARNGIAGSDAIIGAGIMKSGVITAANGMIVFTAASACNALA